MVDSTMHFSGISGNTRRKSTGHLERTVSDMKRRTSSFTSSSSPWFRRNSFLSSDMIKNENCLVYELPSYYSEASSYNVISLKECQGFVFNQDLFASPYQQLKSLANERKIRALSFTKSRRSNSNSKSTTPVGANCSPETLSPAHQKRRHTMYDLRGPERTLESADELKEGITLIQNVDNENEHAIVDEYDEYEEELNDYDTGPSNRLYKVHVTEIVVNESDNNMFPS